MVPARCPVLIGRRAELAALRAAVDGARSGRGGTRAVLGPPGIGKTRLVREITTTARASDVPVSVGRATGTGVGTAFRPIAEALLAALRRRPELDDPALTPMLPVLGRILPQWRRGPVPDDSVVILGEAVLRLLSVLAGQRGLVLVLEDLHWADPETLAIVEYLADNIADERVALLLTSRPDPCPALTLLQALEARGGCTRLVLPPLEAAEVDAMAEACAGNELAEHVRTTLRRRAGGTPLLVEELLAAGVDTASAVPASIAELTARRLAVLAPPTRRSVEAAAVLGEQFDWQVLVHLLAEVDRDTDVVAALREATAAGLVDPVNAEEFRFHHVLARDAVLQSILPPDLSRWARHALAAVVAVHPQLDGVWCEIAADLAVRAGDANRAAEVLLEAGRRNLGRGALASAEAVLRRARGLVEDGATPTAELDDLLAEVLAQAGKPTDAVDVATRSIERLRRAGAPGPTLAEAHLRLARIHITAGTWHAADEHLDAAAAHPVDDAVRLRIEAARAHTALGDSRLDQARRAAERVLRGTGNGTDLAEVACDALLVLGRLARRNDLAAAEALLTRARVVADRAGLSVAATRAVEELAIVDAQESLHLDRLQEARARAARHGDIAAVAVLDLQLTATHLSKWEPDQALAAADRCIAASRRFALPTLPKALALSGVAADCLGDPARSDTAYAEALRLAPDDTHLRGELCGARAYLRLQSADDARALDDLREAMSWFARRPNEVTGSPAVGLWVLLSTVADADRPGPPAPPDPVVTRWNRGLVAFAEAVARGRRGDTAGAESAFAAADATMRSPVDIAWNRMQARRLVVAAAVADGWGHPAEWATEDLPGIDRRGLTGWAAALRGLIRRAGGTVPRRGHATGTVPDHLRALGITARETEVLLLVGEGITNNEIARRLYLSPRTVEKHVEHLMTKTGVNRRIELVAYAARALVSAYHGQSRDTHSPHSPG